MIQQRYLFTQHKILTRSEFWTLGAHFMSSNYEWFQTFKEIDGRNVILNNNKACNIQGIGSIKVRMFDGCDRVLENVRYVPKLRRNLISLRMLDLIGGDEGCERCINCDERDSSKGIYSLIGLIEYGITTSVVTKYKKETTNQIVSTNGENFVIELKIFSTNGSNRTNLWHKRLGHVSKKGLNELYKRGLHGKEKLKNLECCEHCVYGKSHRVKFRKSVHTTQGILDYVHADLWGAARVQSHGEGMYFLSLVNDYPRKLWVYILKGKDETFDRFKEWRMMVENKTMRKFKNFISDNGLEFYSEWFDGYSKNEGIRRHKTIRITSQQNVLGEKMNKTILERVRCMLSIEGLPRSFWAEVVMTTKHLINRCPLTAIGLKTPQEV